MVESAQVPQDVKDAAGPIGPLVIETVGEAADATDDGIDEMGDDIKDRMEEMREDRMDEDNEDPEGGDTFPFRIVGGEGTEAEGDDRAPAGREAAGGWIRRLAGLGGGAGDGTGEDAGEEMGELGDPYRQYMDAAEGEGEFNVEEEEEEAA